METPGPKIPDWISARAWGDVAPDHDVRPFSALLRGRSDTNRNNKRHHFVSVTYMNGFCDEGYLWAYRSEAPGDPNHVKPTGTGFEKYYYAYKREDGTQDNHSFEDHWNLIETVWPETLAALKTGRVSDAVSFNVLGMAGIMRTRVPAARDRKELLLAVKLREEAKALERLGALPRDLEPYRGRLDEVPVGINPEQSLVLMSEDQFAFGDLCFKMGFEILHNTTDVAFLTSDNPVCIYDPGEPFERRVPYDWDREVELLFPLDARTLLRGSNRIARRNAVSAHRKVADTQTVRRHNRTIAQFSYRLLLSKDRSADRLASLYAATVPTVDVSVVVRDRNIQIVHRDVFGPMPKRSLFVDGPEKAARLAPEWQLPGKD